MKTKYGVREDKLESGLIAGSCIIIGVVSCLILLALQ